MLPLYNLIISYRPQAVNDSESQNKDSTIFPFFSIALSFSAVVLSEIPARTNPGTAFPQKSVETDFLV
jgi:hypothetical protein